MAARVAAEAEVCERNRQRSQTRQAQLEQTLQNTSDRLSLFHEHLNALEQNLFAQRKSEQDIREAEVCEIKELIGSKASACEAHHSSMMYRLAAEKEARERQ